MIVFSQNESGDFVARHGSIEVSAKKWEATSWELLITQHSIAKAAPCDDYHFDNPACSAGKNLEEVSDLDLCELSCPVMQDVEVADATDIFWGGTLPELVVMARNALLEKDQPFNTYRYNIENARYFKNNRWLIDGDLY